MSAERTRSATLHSASANNEKPNLATIEEDFNAAQADSEKDIAEKDSTDKKPVVDDDEPEKLKGCERVLEAIWPIRGKHRSEKDSGEGFIKTTLRNLFIYIFFLVVLSLIVYGMVGLINFYFSSGMLSLFIDTSINEDQPDLGQKTFRGDEFPMVTQQDAWKFLRGPLLDGLHWETWFDLSNTTKENIGFIFYENKLLGRPRILQIRVKNQSCEVPSAMRKFITKCDASYSKKVEDNNPFGKAANGLNESDVTYDAWHFKTDSDSASYEGQVATYPGNGYAILLGQYRSESEEILDDLYQNLWIDDKTRAIIIDFSVYNGNINLFNQMRLVMEFPSTGGILTSWSVRTAKLLRYVSSFDYFIALCEFVFIIFIVYYTIEEALDCRFNGLKYFKDPFNILDIFILTLSYATMGFSVYRTIRVNTLLDRLLLNNSSFQNFETLTFVQELFNQTSAVIVFLSWIKVFKFISINKALEQLGGTVKYAFKDLMYFFVVFFIVFTGYAALGNLLFGDFHSDYHNTLRTFFTLFRIILGDFDIVGLSAVSPVMGRIYFISYIFIAFFVLMNMFMAIINDAYAAAADDIASKPPELMFTDFVKAKYGRLTDKFAKRNKMIDADEIINLEEVKEKSELEFGLWRKEMKRRGYADMEIETFFSKYDKDCDRTLNHNEMKALKNDIKKAKSHIEEKFQKNPDLEDEEEESADFGEEINEQEDGASRMMNRDDFDYVLGRIDRMELSVASIVNKIDKLFTHLENMEIEKMKKRQELSNILAQQENQELNIDEMIGPTEFQ